ncbi:MAG: glycosyltransferase 87 family protein [Chloroflexota bacterium]
MQTRSLRIILIVSIGALITIYGIWWTQMIGNAQARTGTDFMAFYAAGRVAQLHGYPDMYNIRFQQNVQQTVVGFELGEGQVLLYNHLPYLVPVLRLIVNADYQGSFIRWEVLLALIYILTTLFLINSLFADKDLQTRLLLAGGCLTFFPLFISIWQGQDTAFLFLGLALWCVGMLKKQDLTAAVGLTLVTTRPHLCIALALPLVFRHWRIAWRFAGLAGVLAIFSILILTPNGVIGFLNLLRISAEGTWFGMKPEAMHNLLGLIIRSFPSLDASTINILSWIIFGIGLTVIATLWARAKYIDERLLGLTVILLIVTAPHLHLHDLTILIIPILLVIRSERLKVSHPALLLIGTSFIFLTGMLIDSLYYVLPYGVLIYLTWALTRNKGSLPSEPLTLKE